MSLEQIVIAVVLTVATTIATTIAGAYVSKRFRSPGLVKDLDKEVDEQGETLIARLRTRLELAEEDAKKAVALAAETESKRQACEEEIGRLRRDLRSMERELLGLYRRTRTPAPRTLVKRHDEHNREDPT